MTRRWNLLGGLLGVQLILIGAVWFAQSGVGDVASGTLLDFAPEAADEVQISSPDAEQAVVIRRTDGGWQLRDGLPADAAKVNEILERLADLRAPWAVATSASAQRRFEVTADQHQRHVVVSSGGDTVAELYLGTSPGYQRVHARAADADAVFSVGLSNYQLPADPADWLDKTLLQPEGEIARLESLGAWQLRRADDGWQLDDGTPDPESADKVVRRFAELRVSGTAAAPADPDEPAGSFRVEDAAGDYTLEVYAAGEDDGYVVRSSRREGYFGLAGYLADQMLVERQALLPAAEAPSQDDGEAD